MFLFYTMKNLIIPFEEKNKKLYYISSINVLKVTCHDEKRRPMNLLDVGLPMYAAIKI